MRYVAPITACTAGVAAEGEEAEAVTGKDDEGDAESDCSCARASTAKVGAEDAEYDSSFASAALELLTLT